jgi:hypothetical protein
VVTIFVIALGWLTLLVDRSSDPLRLTNERRLWRWVATPAATCLTREDE